MSVCTRVLSGCDMLHMYSTSQKKPRFRAVPFRFISRSVPFFFPFHPFRSVPFRSVPFRSVHSVHFHSNRLPRANSFSARHEFVCKIHCVRWRSIARLFSTTIDEEMGFSHHEKGYRPHPIALFIARVRAGP